MTDLALAVLAADSAGADGARPQDDAARNDQIAKLQDLGKRLAETRDEAQEGRRASGIEQIWQEDREHYEGIDDANRGAVAGGDTKPPGQLAPQVVDGNDQCIEFVNITRPYVDAAAAKIGDILLPTDERSWSIKPPPIPELADKAKGIMPVQVQEGMATLDVPEDVKQKALAFEMQHARKLMAEAKAKAERAQKRMDDWQTEGGYHGAMRQVLEDAAKIGTGVLKGPVPEKKKQQMFKDGALVIEEVTKPVSKRVSADNCFPDPACGASIHNGRYFWERDYLTPRQLSELKKQDGYLADQIQLCIDEGPQHKSQARKLANGHVIDDKGVFEVWYGYCYATRDECEAAGVPLPTGLDMIPVIFTLVNDRVIKGAVNPFDTGEFPYDFFQWQKRENSPWGTGVARQIRSAQRIVVAGVRVMLTNAGRAAGPLIVLMDGVKGADGSDDILPWKVYRVAKTSTVDAADKAVSLQEVPALTNELMQIVQFGLAMAENTTGLPALLQGQKGDAPDTYGGQLLIDRNASGTLRRLARNVDDGITEPHTKRYYTYLLLYGPEDSEKGLFVIDARGSTALVEKELARQRTAVLLNASLNPAFGLDPRKTMAEDLRANNLDPEAYQYTEEEWQQLQKQRSQQPPNPAVQVAQIKEDGANKRLAATQQFEAQQNSQDRNVDLITQQILEHIEEMKLTGAQEINFQTLKAELAGTALKLRVQQALSANDAARHAQDIAHEKDMAIADHKMTHHLETQAITPPTEPVGKAPPGEAFEK